MLKSTLLLPFLLFEIKIIPVACFLTTGIVHSHREAMLAKQSPIAWPSNGVSLENIMSLSMAKEKGNQGKPPSALFEVQEVRAQLATMSKSNISPRRLNPAKQEELQNYLRAILRQPSPIPLRNLADDGAKALHGSWRLGFASTEAAFGDLPPEADVVVRFHEGYKCDYSLNFVKRVLGLESLTARSTYMIDASPLNPGLVTIVYQDIVSNMFGMKDLTVGLFGMLKGRETYIESYWFDGRIWVERGYSQDGVEYFNVYSKLED